jgi:hypothetical protein
VNDGIVALANGILTDVRDPSACAGQSWGCWFHHPLPHPLSDAPVIWRSDKQTAERRCPHGIGHPDRQDVVYKGVVRGRDVSVHGCDGCCGPLSEEAT